MPNQPSKRRIYGYINKEKPPSQEYRSHKKGLNFNKVGVFLLAILFFPFRVIGWGFMGLSKHGRSLFWKYTFWGSLTLLVLGFLGLTIVTVWVSRDLPDPDKLTDRKVAQSTKIYDRSGTHLLYEIFADQKRTLVDLNDIPKNVINGVIATEDTTFFQHKGIRPLSILRSFVYGLFGKGKVGGGASTLTQQLVKNAILTNEKTITRKLKEIILSLRLEQKYSKEQILKIYFNEIPYGSTNYGIEAAAQSYFGKHVKDVTLSEAATLAGLPKSPSVYLQNNKLLKQRRDFVLERMFEEGYISAADRDSAQAEPVNLSQKTYGQIVAPHFVQYVKKQLADMYGEAAVETGGLTVITTLDWNKQQIAEKAIKDNADKLLKEGGANNAALVAIDPKTGDILAHVGSSDYTSSTNNGYFDVITQGQLQPGSSIKPIIYAAAFEKGYTPDTLLFDVSTNFAISGKEYRPNNYDRKDHGVMTMRTALQGSINIPAVQTLYLVGEQKALDFTERMGYTTLRNGDFGLTLVLGGGAVIPLEHVNAYAVFANNGYKHTPRAILKVDSPTGDNLFTAQNTIGDKVLDEKITATISNVLSDDSARAFVFGAGGVLTLPDRPVAAKTGTTQEYKDAWTVGYTPSLVAGVWAGNSDGHVMKPGYGGSKLAGVIWNQFMKNTLTGTPVEMFPDPPPNDAVKPILRGSQTGNIVLLIDKITGKIATSSTPPEYIVERSYIPEHSILHYVNKDDPRGPEPTNPEIDPQYSVWEEAIQDWIKKNKEQNPNRDVSFSDPPTEYDDPNTFSMLPSLEVLTPTPSSTLFSRHIAANIKTSSPRGVTKVTYKIDGVVVAILDQAPFNLDLEATTLSNGYHQLSVEAEDDIANRRIVDVPFLLSSSGSIQ